MRALKVKNIRDYLAKKPEKLQLVQAFIDEDLVERADAVLKKEGITRKAFIEAALKMLVDEEVK